MFIAEIVLKVNKHPLSGKERAKLAEKKHFKTTITE